MRVLYDLVIVGGGAAGLTAALYASRSGLDCIVLDSSSPEGSSIALTDAVENYTGFSDIAGFDLIQHFYSHAKSFGANFVRQSLVGIRKNYDGFILECSDSEVKTKSVILCMGATHKKLGIDGENKFEGRGVSYCAVCDGYFFNVMKIDGDEKVKSVTLDNEKILKTDGVFVAVGLEPRTECVKGFVKTDDNGYVIAGETCQTSVSGIFVAGDIRTKNLRQIITACCDGANSVYGINKFLKL